MEESLKNVVFPGLGDAVGFRLQLIQELTCSTPMHIVYKFMDFSLWQETAISFPPPTFPHSKPTNKKSLH